ncbi:MAG: Do family serine endopeptidase [Pseudomonadota bacterium]
MINKLLLPFLVLCLVSPAIAADEARIVPKSQEQVQLSFAPVVKQVSPAVVNIYTKRTVTVGRRSPFFNDPFFSPFFGDNMFGRRMRKQVESALGSGVILDSDGLVVTNAHVIDGAEEITVVLSDGRELEAKLSLLDKASDLALLRADTKGEKLPYTTLKPSESLEVGDIVIAIGNPFAVGQTVTSGIVSATGRSSLDINDFNFFIQTDAAINPGNSGGPLVALDGKVVGINTAIYSRSGGSMGIGFAVPSEMVASVIAAEGAGQSGKDGIIRPWLGVSAQALTSDIAESLGLKGTNGALIKDLHTASPLKKSGVKVGDIVLSVNEREIRSPSEMKFRMATVPLGGQATVQVQRKGKIQSFKVKAIAPPDIPPRNETELKGQHYLSGATIANMNPAVAVELGYSGGSLDDEQGVVVTNAPRGTPAYRILNEGDIILKINDNEIETVEDVRKAVSKLKSGFSIVIKSNGQTRQIILR